MSEEAPVKRPADDAAEGDSDSESAAKRPRLEESKDGEVAPSASTEQAGASGEGVSAGGGSSESDEEYQADSEEEVLSDEGESSDGEEDEDEEIGEEGSGEEPEPNIICGTQVEVKAIKDGKYSLFQKEDGKEFKMIVVDQDRDSAAEAIGKKQKIDIIPVIEATGVEIAKDDEDELIVYVDSIGTGNEGYPFFNEGQADDKEKSLLQGNVWAVVKVKGRDELFATSDLTIVHEA